MASAVCYKYYDIGLQDIILGNRHLLHQSQDLVENAHRLLVLQNTVRESMFMVSACQSPDDPSERK